MWKTKNHLTNMSKNLNTVANTEIFNTAIEGACK